MTNAIVRYYFRDFRPGNYKNQPEKIPRSRIYFVFTARICVFLIYLKSLIKPLRAIAHPY